MANLDDVGRRNVLSKLEVIEEMCDIVIIDTGAGLGPNTLAFSAAAERVAVVTTPDPTAMTDAYGMIKALVPRGGAR